MNTTDWTKPETLTAIATLITIIVLVKQLKTSVKQSEISNSIKKIEFIHAFNTQLERFRQTRKLLKLHGFLDNNQFTQDEERDIFFEIRDYAVIFESILPAIRCDVISREDFAEFFGGRFTEFYYHNITQKFFGEREFQDMHGNMEELAEIVRAKRGAFKDPSSHQVVRKGSG